MGAVGIIAEYNPFHLGHGGHIRQTRQLLGADKPVVCVMSGNWVQRGECALTDKWARAAMALHGGVDLVLELSLPWAISSAEQFARGAVRLLAATGVVDALSFGSECGDAGRLRQLAISLESEGYREELTQALGEGLSFPVARQRAVEALLQEQGGDASESVLLSQPNNNLGVEYIRALYELKSSIQPVTVLRKGVSHDSDCLTGDFASASALRALARQGEWENFSRWTPPGTAETVQQAGIADMARVERAILARLRTMTEADFAALPDSGAAEGLPARLVEAARQMGTLEEFYTQAKTRRYTHARLRRLALWAFLGLTQEDRPEAGPALIRVLGMNDRGKVLLREMKKCASVPVLTKPAHIQRLDGQARRLFELECRGSDLFALCFDIAKPCGMDYTTGPVVLES